MQKILIVEDCKTHRELLKNLLAGYDLTIIETRSAAERLIQAQSFDLLLLDILLEDGDGLWLCRAARQSQTNAQTPVLFLTSRSEIKDRLAGFDIGADDYVVKPFNHQELKARVTVLLRRSHQTKDTPVLRYGPLEVDSSTLTAWLHVEGHKHSVELTSSEFKLLVYLIKNSEVIVSREKILNSVWQQGAIHVIDRTVDAKISLLRKKLHPLGGILKSIYGVGYCLSLNDLEQFHNEATL